MRRRPRVGGPDEEREQPLPPVATGIVLGLWIALMLVLALVVVPLLFSTCAPAQPGT